MKILLDHNLDRRLKQYLTDYAAATTQEQGWADFLNGELLSFAEQNGFEVLLTADSNIKSQQNITGRRIAILVLRAFNNRLATHKEKVDQIHAALSNIQAGEILEIFHHDLTERRSGYAACGNNPFISFTNRWASAWSSRAIMKKS